jgi:hypothetical protein
MTHWRSLEQNFYRFGALGIFSPVRRRSGADALKKQHVSSKVPGANRRSELFGGMGRNSLLLNSFELFVFYNTVIHNTAVLAFNPIAPVTLSYVTLARFLDGAK